MPMERYYKEADKYDLLCTNCHIEETYKNDDKWIGSISRVDNGMSPGAD